MTSRRRPRQGLLLMAVAVAVGALAFGATVAARRERAPERPRPATRTFAVPGQPSAVVVARELVWVADDERHSVYSLDARTGKVVGRPIPVERNPIALAAGDGSLWVAHASGVVVHVDTRVRRADAPIHAGESITGIAVTGDSVWAADLPGNALVEIDARSSRIVRRVPIPDGAVRVVAADQYLWVTNRERTVTRVRAASGEVGPAVDVGLGPIGAAFDGRLIWVANSDDGTVGRLSARTATLVGRPVRVGRGPVAVAVSGRLVAVANQDDGTMSLIDAATGKVHGDAVFLGLRPRGIAAGGGVVWAVGHGGPTNQGAVVRVDLRRVA
jgi:serine/threonine-protein kinase